MLREWKPTPSFRSSNNGVDSAGTLCCGHGTRVLRGAEWQWQRCDERSGSSVLLLKDGHSRAVNSDSNSKQNRIGKVK
jgi:hypothetical protein